MNKLRKSLSERSASAEGFTLVELLVVVAIIGLLALIAIPTFLNQRSKAQDSDAKSSVRNAESSLVTLKDDATNQWDSANLVTDLSDAEGAYTFSTTTSASDPKQVAVLSPSATSVTLAAQSASGNVYCVTVANEGADSKGEIVAGACNGAGW